MSVPPGSRMTTFSLARWYAVKGEPIGRRLGLPGFLHVLLNPVLTLYSVTRAAGRASLKGGAQSSGVLAVSLFNEGLMIQDHHSPLKSSTLPEGY